jgi:shikimate kinase
MTGVKVSFFLLGNFGILRARINIILSMPNKIVLIGMRGSGKSHFGSCLSQILGWPKIDMDDEIELVAGKTIPSIVETQGWEVFREQEHQMAKKVSGLKNLIISTGGGAITFERNQKYLKNSETIVVFLFATLEDLVDRLSKDDNERPELEEGVGIEAELRKTWEERKDIYFEMSDIIFRAKPDLDEDSRINVEKNAMVLAKRIERLL